jgi:hypothetical protein
VGHYYAEMACPKCLKVRCTCPPKPDPSLQMWIVDDDLTPIQIQDFDKKHAYVKTKWGNIPGHPMLYRLNKKKFETKKEAQEHAKVVRAEMIADFEAALVETKARIKELKKRKL